MENVVRVGLSVLIKNGNKILLGRRSDNYPDTGGIYEPGSWTLPGGKQEFNETIYEGAIRETKEETNIDISNIELFDAVDDIQPNKHFVTIHVLANNYSGEPEVMEPGIVDEWKWFEIGNLPDNIYSPSKKFIEKYISTYDK